jgi:Uma2 family endonuclease
MTTALKMGPADHGRLMDWEEYITSEWESGYQYELVDGRLYVSPMPEAPQGVIEFWLFYKLIAYAIQRPEVINFVYNKTRVFIPNRPRITSLEPDVSCYSDFPHDRPLGEIDWRNTSPILVAEVLSPNDPNKDLVRNIPLYLAVPTIREYWILDNRTNPDQPSLRVHRRRGQRWQNVIEVGFGETYTTRLLPGFSVILDPRQ